MYRSEIEPQAQRVLNLCNEFMKDLAISRKIAIMNEFVVLVKDLQQNGIQKKHLFQKKHHIKQFLAFTKEFVSVLIQVLRKFGQYYHADRTYRQQNSPEYLYIMNCFELIELFGTVEAEIEIMIHHKIFEPTVNLLVRLADSPREQVLGRTIVSALTTMLKQSSQIVTELERVKSLTRLFQLAESHPSSIKSWGILKVYLTMLECSALGGENANEKYSGTPKMPVLEVVVQEFITNKLVLRVLQSIPQEQDFDQQVRLIQWVSSCLEACFPFTMALHTEFQVNLKGFTKLYQYFQHKFTQIYDKKTGSHADICHLEQVIQALASYSTIGNHDIHFLEQQLQRERNKAFVFVDPNSISVSHNIICNQHGLLLLYQIFVFLKQQESFPGKHATISQREKLLSTILRHIHEVLIIHPLHYLIAQNCKVIENILYDMNGIPELAQIAVGSLLAGIAVELKIRPYFELGVLFDLLLRLSPKERLGLHLTCVVLDVLTNLMNFNSLFLDDLRETGAIDVVVELLSSMSAEQEHTGSSVFQIPSIDTQIDVQWIQELPTRMTLSCARSKSSPASAVESRVQEMILNCLKLIVQAHEFPSPSIIHLVLTPELYRALMVLADTGVQKEILFEVCKALIGVCLKNPALYGDECLSIVMHLILHDINIIHRCITSSSLTTLDEDGLLLLQLILHEMLDCASMDVEVNTILQDESIYPGSSPNNNLKWATAKNLMRTHIRAGLVQAGGLTVVFLLIQVILQYAELSISNSGLQSCHLILEKSIELLLQLISVTSSTHAKFCEYIGYGVLGDLLFQIIDKTQEKFAKIGTDSMLSLQQTVVYALVAFALDKPKEFVIADMKSNDKDRQILHVIYPGAMLIDFQLISLWIEKNKCTMDYGILLKYFHHLAKSLRNCQAFACTRFVHVLLNTWAKAQIEIGVSMIQFLECIAGYSVTHSELREWFCFILDQIMHARSMEFSYLQSLARSVVLNTQSRLTMAALPFMHFELASNESKGFAYLQIAQLSSMTSHRKRLWPGPNGYTYSCWLQLHTTEKQDERESAYAKLWELRRCVMCRQRVTNAVKLKCGHGACRGCLAALLDNGGQCTVCSSPLFYLVRLISLDRKSSTELFLINQKLYMRTNHSKAIISFEHRPLETGKWYHICLLHLHKQFQGSLASLYINGLLQQKLKVSYPIVSSTAIQTEAQSVTGLIGVPSQSRRISSASWRLSGCFLINEPIAPSLINSLFAVGPAYDRLFYGDQEPSQVIISKNKLSLDNLKLLEEDADVLPLPVSAAVSTTPVNSPSTAMNVNQLKQAVDNAAESISTRVNRHSRRTTRSKRIEFGFGLLKKIQTAVPLTDLSGLSADSVVFAYNVHSLDMARGAGVSQVKIVDSIYSSSHDGHPVANLMGGIECHVPKGIAQVAAEMANGGISLVLLLIEAAKTQSNLEDGIEIVSHFMTACPHLLQQMEHQKSYSILSFLLKNKAQAGLVSHRVVRILFQIVGLRSADPQDTPSEHLRIHFQDFCLSNILAFQSFILDYRIWQYVDIKVQQVLFHGLHDIFVHSDTAILHRNRLLVQPLGIVRQLLYVLLDPKLPSIVLHQVVDLIHVFIIGEKHASACIEIHEVALFLTSTLSKEFGEAFNQHQHHHRHTDLSSPPRHVQERLALSPRGFRRGGRRSNKASRQRRRQFEVSELLFQMLTSHLQAPAESMSPERRTALHQVLNPTWLSFFVGGNLQNIDDTMITPQTILDGMQLLVLLAREPSYQELIESHQVFDYFAFALPSSCTFFQCNFVGRISCECTKEKTIEKLSSYDHQLWFYLLCIFLGPPASATQQITCTFTNLQQLFKANIEANRVSNFRIFQLMLILIRRFYYDSLIPELLDAFRQLLTQTKAYSKSFKEHFSRMYELHEQILRFLLLLMNRMSHWHQTFQSLELKVQTEVLTELVLLIAASAQWHLVEYHHEEKQQTRNPFNNPVAVTGMDLLIGICFNFILYRKDGDEVIKQILQLPMSCILSPSTLKKQGIQQAFQMEFLFHLLNQLKQPIYQLLEQQVRAQSEASAAPAVAEASATSTSSYGLKNVTRVCRLCLEQIELLRKGSLQGKAVDEGGSTIQISELLECLFDLELFILKQLQHLFQQLKSEFEPTQLQKHQKGYKTQQFKRLFFSSANPTSSSACHFPKVVRSFCQLLQSEFHQLVLYRLEFLQNQPQLEALVEYLQHLHLERDLVFSRCYCSWCCSIFGWYSVEDHQQLLTEFDAEKKIHFGCLVFYCYGFVFHPNPIIQQKGIELFQDLFQSNFRQMVAFFTLQYPKTSPSPLSPSATGASSAGASASISATPTTPASVVNLYKGGFDLMLQSDSTSEEIVSQFQEWVLLMKSIAHEEMESPLDKFVKQLSMYAHVSRRQFTQPLQDHDKQQLQYQLELKHYTSRQMQLFLQVSAKNGKQLAAIQLQEQNQQTLWVVDQDDDEVFTRRQWKLQKQMLTEYTLCLDKTNMSMKASEMSSPEIMTAWKETFCPTLHEEEDAGVRTRSVEWRVDYTEGPYRMRKRVVEYQPDAPAEHSTPSTAAPSPCAGNRVQRRFSDGDLQLSLADASPATATSPATFARNSEQGSDITNALYDAIDAKLHPLLVPGDEIGEYYDCLRVNGLDTCHGVLLFGTEHMYMIDNYQLVYDASSQIQPTNLFTANLNPTGASSPSTMGSRDAATLTPVKAASKEIIVNGFRYNSTIDIQYIAPTSNSMDIDSYSEPTRVYLYEEITELHKRRCQLRHVAVEVFAHDGQNFLVSFESVESRERAFNAMLRQCPNVKGASSGMDTNVGDDFYSQVKKFVRNTMTERWQLNKISNFEYLMHLNTLAGRSYNDLTQYPVFPWVLRDYTSDTIDLDDPKVYRDLSKPMGAIAREDEFRTRYESLKHEAMSCTPGAFPGEEATGTSKPFHYGTHYSSAAIVLHYLIRLQPFSNYHQRFQGGEFDHPDRLFRSIHQSWASAAGLDTKQQSTQDVKELIPEFFYFPEFLTNVNEYDLGTTADGKALNDVELPPWAHGNPQEFIRINRQALESNYVSAHLHKWIDLIFGYKQVGKEAVDACNVFYYLTYEGAIDLDQVQDGSVKQAYLDQIREFGQTPSQLFRTPHPVRGKLRPNVHIGDTFSLETTQSSMFTRLQNNLLPGATMGAAESIDTTESHTSSEDHGHRKNSKLFMSSPRHAPKTRVAADLIFRLLMSPWWRNLQHLPPTTGQYYPIGELAFYGGKTLSHEKLLAVTVNCIFLPPKNQEYIAFGFHDKAVRIASVGADEGHSGEGRVVAIQDVGIEVANACVTEDGSAFLASSKTAPTIRLYNISSAHRYSTSHRLRDTNIQLYSPLHGPRITALAASRAYSIIVSGCNSGRALLWDLNRVCLIRQLRKQQHTNEISGIRIHKERGDIVVCAATGFDIFDVNGNLMVSSPSQAFVIRSICLHEVSSSEWESEHGLISGHDDGSIMIWTYTHQAVTLRKHLRSYQPHSDSQLPAITSLLIKNDQSGVITGNSAGQVVVWSRSASNTKN